MTETLKRCNPGCVLYKKRTHETVKLTNLNLYPPFGVYSVCWINSKTGYSKSSYISSDSVSDSVSDRVNDRVNDRGRAN